MFNIKIFAISLGLLLSFVTQAADNSITNDNGDIHLSGETKMARIISNKAIVYADENMLVPLGYIAHGKAVSVGNPRRINRELVPLIVYGRLAFIELKDIRYEDSNDEEYNSKRGAPREHDVDIMIQKPDERLSENNSAYLSLHTFKAGNEVKQAFLDIDNTNKSSFTGFNLQLIHRQSLSRYFWGVALDYSGISSENMKLGYWMLMPTAGYTLLNHSLFLLDIYASMDLALAVEYEVKKNEEEEPAGYVWGPQINARIVLLPNSKYHIFGGVGFRKYSVIDLAPLKNLNNQDIPGIKNISGVSLFAGFAMEFK